MKLFFSLGVLITLNVSAGETLPTADYVNIKEYVGKWYSITALPQFFTRKCAAQTADYAIKDTKSISVLNTCIRENGKSDTISGQAVVINPKTNAELIVTFNSFWTRLFNVKGDYTIIKLDEAYSTVLIGSKDRKSLWIMSRTPYLNEDVKAEYVNYAKSLHFDTSKLVDSKF